MDKFKNNKGFWPGFDDILKAQAEKQKHLDQELETLPYTTETFKKQEWQEISKIKQKLDNYKNEFDVETQSIDVKSLEYVKICNKYVEKIMLFLDEQSLWAHKFSTECSGGGGEGEPEITPDDSIYYMTQSGISLRLKRSNRHKGLRNVIQPFMEKIVFNSPDMKKIIVEPKVGYFVKEYLTKDFLDKQNENPDDIKKDYDSTIKTYYKNSKIYHIKALSTIRPHEGDRVNKNYNYQQGGVN